MKTYVLFNATDGVPADPREFHTLGEAVMNKKAFIERFKLQGYYKTAAGQRIDPRDIEIEIQEVS